MRDNLIANMTKIFILFLRTVSGFMASGISFMQNSQNCIKYILYTKVKAGVSHQLWLICYLSNILSLKLVIWLKYGHIMNWDIFTLAFCDATY